MKGRYKKIFTVLILLVVAMLALSGCSGNDGSNGATGDTGATGTTGATGATGKDAATSVAALSTTDLTALAFSQTDSKVTGVTISSPPVVKFTLKDAAGRGITGLGFTSKNSTATVAGLTNIQFILAKLVPGTNGSPSRWVNYGVTTVPTTTAPTVVPRLPATDSNGTLKDNGDGTYEYTFYRDITKVKDVVAAATVTAPNDIADLGDLTYDSKLTHRLVIQIGGNTRGTGTNTANGVQVTPGVPMANPINIVYDFIPATDTAVTATDTQREIVKVANCFECHGKFSGIHGGDHLQGTPGSRQDTRACVLCHTEQQKYGFAEAATTATGYSGDTRKINGFAVGYFPAYIHRIHMGEGLTKTGYNFAGILFNEVTFPQDQRNCRKCHAGDTTAQLAATPQGNNWKTNPTREACGACHDNVDFAAGTNHIGGRQTSDALCTICHADVDIELYHVPVNKTTAASGANNYYANNGNLPSGAYKIEYVISSVTVDAARKPSVKFQIKKDGTAVTFGTYNAATNANLIPNTIGGPSIRIAYNVTQDGITSPADFNAAMSVTLGVGNPTVSSTGVYTAPSITNSLWANAGTLTASGITWTLTGPDASGLYTVSSSLPLPASTTMATALLYGSVTQTNVTGYPYSAASLADFKLATGSTTSYYLLKPGLILNASIATKAVTSTGFTARRTIVDNAKCNACHDQLGVKPNFHGGARNNGTICNICHTPNGVNSGWSYSFNTWVHAIHGAEKRSVAYTFAEDWSNVTFPGILRNCERCHLSGTYDPTAVGNRLYNTVATGTTVAAGANTAPYIVQVPGTAANGGIYGSGFSYSTTTGAVVTTEAAATTLVSSPTAAACFSCHDTSLARAHMESNGGSVYAVRSTALANTEQCLLCHGTGKVADIKAMHIK